MKIFEGLIISTKTKDTAVVEVTKIKPHPLYRKLIKKSKRYKVDTKGFEVSLSNRVKIAETRPISKDKHFKVIKVLTAPREEKK